MQEKGFPLNLVHKYVRMSWVCTHNAAPDCAEPNQGPHCQIVICRQRENGTAVELVRNLVAHGDAREGKWRGKWRTEWVASTLTPSPNVVYPALLKLMRTPRLPAVDWTDTPTDLNGLVRFRERQNLVSAHVPSRSARAIPVLVLFHEQRKSCNARPRSIKGHKWNLHSVRNHVKLWCQIYTNGN